MFLLIVRDKIGKICTDIYGADGVTYSEKAESQIDNYAKAGFDKLPICMAKVS